MKDDNIHRKEMMLMRVHGLNKIAPKFKYFDDVKPLYQSTKNAQKSR